MAVREGSGWTRRSVLRAAGLGAAGIGAAGASGVLAGCSWFAPDPVDPPPPDPLEPLLAATRHLVARYESTSARHPDLTGPLSPLRSAHLAHLAALREMLDRTGDTPSPPAQWVSPPAPVPAEVDRAVASLREAEQEAYEQAVAACLAAPPERAFRLGAICAARATHLEVLP